MKHIENAARQFANRDNESDILADYIILHSHYAHPRLYPKEVAGLQPHDEGYAQSHGRYCDQPMDWRSRLFGIGATATIGVIILACAFLSWRIVKPTLISSSAPLVMDLRPLAAPPEPVREVSPGPEQVEQHEAKSEPERKKLPPPLVPLPAIPSLKADAQKSTEIADPAPPIPETTAPRSLAAPTASRMSSETKPAWEGLILAHLERFRRYPARARAARQQGVAYVRFTMNRAGSVLSSAIARKSGSFDLDQAALDTLQRAQPLPPIPADRPDPIELTIPVEFSFRH